LFIVTHALDTLGFGLGLRKCGQEHACQNGDDSDHNQQFNQREPTLSGRSGKMGHVSKVQKKAG
jgi:hypothetical protein